MTNIDFRLNLMPGRSTPDMPRSSVVGDGKVLAAQSGHRALLSTTESTKYDNADIYEALKPKGFNWVHHRLEEPIYFGPAWERDPEIASYRVKLHGGLFAVSPTRWLNVAFFRYREHQDLRVCMIASHFVSEAWCDHKKVTKQWRKDKWMISYKKLQKEINKIQLAHGLPILVQGDFNTGVHFPGSKMHLASKQEHLYSSTLDHQWLIPGRIPISKLGQSRRTNIHSDHDLVSTTLRARV